MEENLLLLNSWSFVITPVIEHQLTLPYTPHQNGVSERKKRTVMDMARCLLLERKIPSQFWPEAVNTSAYFLNKLPTKSLQDMIHMNLGVGTNNQYTFSEPLDIYVIIEFHKQRRVS